MNKNFPQSDKLAAARDERDTINDFVEWLAEQGIRLAQIPDGYEHTLFPISESSDSLAMRYLEIDTKALEQERRQMLADIREQAIIKKIG